MWLIVAAMRRPITVLVALVAIALCAVLALTRMQVDIFPDLRLPAIYVAQPYGGMDPAQMEGHLVTFYENHFLYMNGIKSIESRSIQGAALIKIFFHPNTDMNQAMAEAVSLVERARSFMPPGTVPPFLIRFDAGVVPVGYLVFKSETRSQGEVQDLAQFRVRPILTALPGVTSPPPFGGNLRTIVIHVDPERLRAYRMSPQEVVEAVSLGNEITPAGNVRIGDLTLLTPVNSIVSNIQDLASLPIRVGAGPAVYLRDIGSIEDASDILTSYALVDGRRAIYIPVRKRADASTLAVVSRVKAALPKFQAVAPDDVEISFEFDQSAYVRNAVKSLVTEGVLGVLLTGLMVLLFLRSWRSALIIVLTIPFSLLAAVVALWAAGQTLNIMTLGGLALAIGVLVDEATVAIENIHTHLAQGKTRAHAILDSGAEVALPMLVSMLCVLAVFVPSFFMVGVGQALFEPLALAVGFAMGASYLLARTFVPVMAAWILRHGSESESAGSGTPFAGMQAVYTQTLRHVVRFRWPVVAGYVLLAGGIMTLLGSRLGMEIFPSVDTGQFQLRVRAPDGTRIERTEVIAQKVLAVIQEEAGPGNVAITLGFVGTQPSFAPVNTLFLWMSGPHEAVLLVALKPGSGVSVEELQERLRRRLPATLPNTRFSFEAGDLVGQVMSMGSPTQIEVAVSGSKLQADRAYAEKLMSELAKIPVLRDLQFGQPLNYPTVNIKVDRERAGQLGATVADVARSLVSATSSTRFIRPIYWRDPSSGVSYQVQVEVPQSQMTSLEDIQNIPVMPPGAPRTLVRDLAEVSYGTMVGEYARYNFQRMVTITANVVGEDMGRAANRVSAAIERVGQPPKGVTVGVRGQIAPMRETFGELQKGMGLAVVVIMLLLAANFQSLRDAFIVISTTPAVIAGVLVALWVTHTTLNTQSFLGAIMAMGVAVANAVLLVTFAERSHREGTSAAEAAVDGAQSRLRPILMTSLAMIAGMIPMALGLGDGGEQTAPLARAVIGGLGAATLATLVVLPAVYAIVQGGSTRRAISLVPGDREREDSSV